MNGTEATFEQVLTLAQQLPPTEQARLIVRLAPAMEQALDQANLSERSARPYLYGALADLGPAPSAEDLDEVRREMWANFPREDI